MAQIVSTEVDDSTLAPDAYSKRLAEGLGDADVEGLPIGEDPVVYLESFDSVFPEWDQSYLKKVQERIAAQNPQARERMRYDQDQPLDEQLAADDERIAALLEALGRLAAGA